MREQFEFLANAIKDQSGHGPIYYLPNHGNWGDALIRQGTLRFFADFDLKYQEKRTINKDWFYPMLRGGTVVFGGGGGWCELWNHAGAVQVRKRSKRFRVIVLPSTYESTYEIPRTVFFCRDHYESQTNMPLSLFCHDMAFFLGDRFDTGSKGSGVGHFFRTDGESAGRQTIPADNCDLSLKGHQHTDVAPLFSAINEFSVIHTDRLHVAIAACLLKKVVHFYAGSTFKNKAVYRSSMQGHFENVWFHD